MVTKSSWYLAFEPRPAARVRLYCLPFAGGGASVFRHWPRFLPPWVEVRAIRLPGRLGRHKEPAFTDCDLAARSLARSLDESLAEPFAESLAGSLSGEPGGRPAPYALFGHSMGAMLAYRVTRLLQSGTGTPLPALLACASWPVRGVAQEAMPDPRDPDERFVAALADIGGMPAEVLADPAARALTLPAVRADFQLCRSYVFRHEPPLPVPLAVFGGADDMVAPPGCLTEWKDHSDRYLGLRLFAGGHFFLHDRISELTASIAACLAQVLDAPGHDVTAGYQHAVARP